MDRVPEPVRSFVLTFLVFFVPSVLATGFVWSWSALAAAALAAVRTAASALLPGGSFGNGAGGTEPPRDYPNDGGDV